MERTLSLNINSDKLRRGLGKVNTSLKKTGAAGKKSAKTIGDAFKSVGKSIFSLQGALAGLIGAAGLGALGKSFLDASVTTEGFKTRLQVLLGSVEEGNRLFKDMSTFASEVPFEFEAIMQSATQLAGVMKGGVDEINEWMPLIGDLAATSGLSIEQTTDQVSRMLSAGAGAADLFRDRGITAMLGFTAGVSVSVEETRKQLMDAWKSPTSQFAGATKLLAANWEGLTSMMADKWFAVRNVIMDEGVMNFIKAIAATVNQYLGKALDKSKTQAKSWANFIIDAMRSIMNGIGFVVNAVHGIGVAWDGLVLGFAVVAEGIVRLIFKIAEGFRQLANIIPGINIGPMTGLENLLGSMEARTTKLATTFSTTLAESMPGDAIEAFAAEVETNFARINEAAANVVPKVTPEVQAESHEFDKGEVSSTTKGIEALEASMLTEEESLASSYERREFMVEDAFQMGLINDASRKELVLGLEKQHADQKLAIAKKSEDDKKKVMSAGLGAAASIFGSLGTLMGKAGKKQSAAQKLMARASIVASTAQAIMNALAVSPYPLGIALAAGAALKGAEQLRSVGGGGGSNMSAPTPISSAPSLAPTPIGTGAQTAASQTTEQTIVLVGLAEHEMDSVLDRMEDQINEGSRVVIRRDSPQAQEILQGAA